MIARFSKRDFRIPGQILDLQNLFRFFFEIEKNREKVRVLEKVIFFWEFEGFSMDFLSVFTKETH